MRSVGRRRVAVAAAVVLAVSGCSLFADPLPETTPVPAPTLTAAPGTEQASDDAAARLYGQDPGWRDCDDPPLQCGRVQVPVDWSHPGGPTLAIALVRVPASAEREGSLLVNFGGPGVSGVDVVTEYGEAVVGAPVAEAYDLVGFDPRGVGASRGVDCVSDRELDAWRAFDTVADADTDPAAAQAELRAAADAFIAGCVRSTGDLLPHLDTVSAARDLDVVRDALGEERLDYLGYSYGTLLGATYADLFPQRVDRFVLDGALDPASSSADVTLGQAAGIERALRGYVAACLAGDAGDCPLSGGEDDAMRQVADVVERADDDPLPSDQPGREVTAGLAFTGVVSTLYDERSWPSLSDALTEAIDEQRGTRLLELADGYADREDDGTYASDLDEAFLSINCADYPVDDSPEAMDRTAAALEEAAPYVGRFMAYGETFCGQWPVPAARTPGPLEAAGSPPVLVIGTTGDPATPYEWAVALADQLEAGVLLTREGEGHTGYGQGSRCVDASVEAWLVRGEIVADGTTCEA